MKTRKTDNLPSSEELLEVTLTAHRWHITLFSDASSVGNSTQFKLKFQPVEDEHSSFYNKYGFYIKTNTAPRSAKHRLKRNDPELYEVLNPILEVNKKDFTQGLYKWGTATFANSTVNVQGVGAVMYAHPQDFEIQLIMPELVGVGEIQFSVPINAWNNNPKKLNNTKLCYLLANWTYDAEQQLENIVEHLDI